MREGTIREMTAKDELYTILMDTTQDGREPERMHAATLAGASDLALAMTRWYGEGASCVLVTPWGVVRKYVYDADTDVVVSERV